MALEVRRSTLADRDLDDIWLYIAIDNVTAADQLVDRIAAAEDRLALFPRLGKARDDIAPDLRGWTVGDYIVLYRVTLSHLEIVRIVHGARDLGDLLNDQLD